MVHGARTAVNGESAGHVGHTAHGTLRFSGKPTHLQIHRSGSIEIEYAEEGSEEGGEEGGAVEDEDVGADSVSGGGGGGGGRKAAKTLAWMEKENGVRRGGSGGKRMQIKGGAMIDYAETRRRGLQQRGRPDNEIRPGAAQTY